MNKFKSDKYFNYVVKGINEWNNFAIVLVKFLEDNTKKVIGVCTINKSFDDDNYYLISDLIIDESYRNNGYGNYLIKSTIEILKELGAVKICSFAEKNAYSNNIFRKLGFSSDENVHEFGVKVQTVPGDDEDLYYELNIKQEYKFDIINDKASAYLGNMMNMYCNEYKDRIPMLFVKSNYDFRLNFRNMNTQENEVGYSVSIGAKMIGYIYMYTVDYDDEHYISLNFEFISEYINKNLFEQILRKSKEFYQSKKEDFDVREIKTYIDDSTIVKSNQKKYITILKEIGFNELNDKEFSYKLI